MWVYIRNTQRIKFICFIRTHKAWISWDYQPLYFSRVYCLIQSRPINLINMSKKTLLVNQKLILYNFQNNYYKSQ